MHPKSLSINDMNSPYLYKKNIYNIIIGKGSWLSDVPGKRRKDNGHGGRGLFRLLYYCISSVHVPKETPFTPQFSAGNQNLLNLFIIMLKKGIMGGCIQSLCATNIFFFTKLSINSNFPYEHKPKKWYHVHKPNFS